MSGFGNLKLVPFRTKPPGRKRKPPPLTFFNLFCLEWTLVLFGESLRRTPYLAAALVLFLSVLFFFSPFVALCLTFWLLEP